MEMEREPCRVSIAFGVEWFAYFGMQGVESPVSSDAGLGIGMLVGPSEGSWKAVGPSGGLRDIKRISS